MPAPDSFQEIDANHIHQLADLIAARDATMLSFRVEEGGQIIKMTFRVTDALFHHIFSITTNMDPAIELAHAERMAAIWAKRFHQLLGDGTYGQSKEQK